MFELPQTRVDTKARQQQADSMSSLESTMLGAFQELIKYLDGKVTKTEVLNQLSSISTPDVQYVVQAINQLDRNVANKKLDLSPILQGLGALESQLKLIPKRLPDTPEKQNSIQISNLSDINKQFASLESAIKGLKLVAEAPKVNVTVPQPKVTIEKTNLAPIQTALMQVLGAIERIHFPETKPTDVSGVEKRLEGLGEWFALVDKNQKETNKHLKKLIDKPTMVSSSSGGGGGGGVPYVTERYDYSGGSIIYTATAPVGTTDSSTGWTITKYDLGSSSAASGKIATDVSWTNRVTGGYT